MDHRPPKPDELQPGTCVVQASARVDPRDARTVGCSGTLAGYCATGGYAELVQVQVQVPEGTPLSPSEVEVVRQGLLLHPEDLTPHTMPEA